MGSRILASFPPDEDGARVRVVEAEEYGHECRLARAVLAEEGVDLVRLDAERYVVVRDDAREHLGDPEQLDREIFAHANHDECEPQRRRDAEDARS